MNKIYKTIRRRQRLLWIPLVLALSGCFENAVPPKAALATATTSSATGMTPASGPMAAKFIFTNSSTTGSFDDTAVLGTGTVPGTGTGLRASRVFLPNNTLLASGYTDSHWPKWLNFLELGVSGPSNTANGGVNKALNPDCARFANANDHLATCDFQNAGSANSSCGAPSGYFRVSEADCALSAPSAGAGDSTDPIYIRAQFNRSTTYLAGYENIMAVLEFVASTITQAPTSNLSCFTGGVFSPDNPGCSDMTWKSYLKQSATLTPMPFMLIVPPAYSYFSTTSQSMVNANVATKQFYLPLGADSTLDTFQLSRIQARAATLYPGGANPMCNPTGGAAPYDSALCLGMVFYSITFYRM